MPPIPPADLSPAWARALAAYQAAYAPRTGAPAPAADYGVIAADLASWPGIRRVVDRGCGFGFAAALFADRRAYTGWDARLPLGDRDGRPHPIPFFAAGHPHVAYRVGWFPTVQPAPAPDTAVLLVLSVGYPAAPPDPDAVAAALVGFPLV